MRKILKPFLFVMMFVCLVCCFAAGCGTVKVSESTGSTGSTESTGSTDPTATAEMQITVDDETDGTVAVDYDGNAQEIALSGVPEGVKVTVTYESETYPASETAPSDAGEYRVTVQADKTADYKAFKKEITLIIGKAQTTFEFTCPDFYEGETIEPEVEVNVSGGAVTYKYKGRGETVYEESAVAPTEIGTYTVTATVAGTNNYYGAQKTADFGILSNDPLYGVPQEQRDAVEGFDRFDVSLGEKSWNTNDKKVSLSRTGVLKASEGKYFMLNADIDTSRIFLLVESSVKCVAYVRFTVGGAYKYQDIVENGTEYCKSFQEVPIETGYQLVAVSTSKSGAFTGDADAPITGFHVMYSANDVNMTVYGVYYRNLDPTEVPSEITERVAGKQQLKTTLAPKSYCTNTQVVMENGVIDGFKNAISVNVSGIGDKVYLVVKSTVEQTVTVRGGVKGNTYETIMNIPGTYCKTTTDVAVAKGFSLLEVSLTPYAGFTGSESDPITCLYFWGAGLIDSGLIIYGVYADEYVGVPQEIFDGVADKQKLETTLAPQSYYTNIEGQTVMDENGVVTSTGIWISLDIQPQKLNKIYVIVKSNAENATMRIDALLESCDTYEKAIATDVNTVYRNTGIVLKQGYQLLEITLNPYNGDQHAGESVGCLYFTENANFAEGVEIYGIYVDTAEEQGGVPQKILDEVADKQKLETTLAPQSYYTNIEGQTVMDENGVVTSTGIWVSLDIQPQKLNKIYVIVKSNAENATMRIDALLEGCDTYEKAIATDVNTVYRNTGIALKQGYQLLEITLNPYNGDQHAGENVGCLYFTENANFAEGVEIYGIYVDTAE